MFHKTISRVIVFVGVVLCLSSYLAPLTSYAWMCAAPPGSFVLSLENGVYKDGFAVQYGCDSYPIIEEFNDEDKEMLPFLLGKIGVDTLTGVYEFKGCFLRSWNEECLKSDTIEKLSDNATTEQLTVIKSQWQQKEQEGLNSAATKKWSVLAIIILAALVAVIWPWALVKIWPNLKKRISILLIVAMFLQLLLAFVLATIFYWSSRLWQTAGLVSSGALIAAIVFEILYLIVKKIRSNRNIV